MAQSGLETTFHLIESKGHDCTPPAYFGEALQDAERLLKYAAETGIEIEDNIRNDVLQARTAGTLGWSEETIAKLLAALTKLSTRLKPVTAESLKACGNTATVRSYWIWAMWLAIFIGPFSVASFLTSAISDAVRKDIATANDLAVKLRAQLGPPVKPSSPLPSGLTEGDVITELQQYASTIRSIDGRARQLNVFVFYYERDPFGGIRRDPAKVHATFQLPAGLLNFAEAANAQTVVYQDVRYFAQNLLEDVSFFYGAITSCILPVLYALLGTCAYLLRSFEDQIRMRTFTSSIANSARFLIAAIGGAVVGLFNNFTITQAASIPPLAIAFLVGYAVDVFFSFLEGLLQAFTKTKAAGSPLTPAL